MRKTALNLPAFSSQKDNKPEGALKSGFKIAFSKVIFYTGSSDIIEKNNAGDIYIGEIN